MLSKRSRRLKKERQFTINDFVRTFKVGDRVVLDIQPYYKSLPHPKFNGRVGVVEAQRGKAYVVRIRDGDAEKRLICLPIHLKKV